MQRQWRLYVVWFFLCVAVSGLVGRLVDLNIIDRSFLLRQSKARILRKVDIPAYRGMITDRLGTPLAISTPVDSIWVNPHIFSASQYQLAKLAQILHLPLSFILKRTQPDGDREFIYIKRAVPPPITSEVRRLKITGLFFQRAYRRYYPESAVTAHVVGLTNIDDKGQEGLELAYNSWLAGTPGRKEVLKDRLGRVIADVALLKKPIQGKKLVLSLDHRIQYLAYRSLAAAVKRYHAQSGSVVVLDVQTGEVLAMVNQPSYNPNRRPKDHDGRYRNRAVTDSFEPGSVMKAFTITLALESGKYTPETKINTNPGWMRIGGYTIHDDLNYGVVNLTELLQKSSNIAAAKILLSLQPQHFWYLLHEFGFGERTQSGFPGEASGILRPHTTWLPSVVATLAYGYGIAITTLQLAHAYAILANGGVSVPVTFLKRTHKPQGTRILPTSIATEIITMLQSVVNKGTGKLAQVPGYTVSGKTGTAYIVGPNGYNHHHHMASFVGVAPASHPRLVIAVSLRNPQGQHFGGQVAAPVFAEVMGDALRLLDIAPDSLTKKSQDSGIMPLENS